MAIASVISILSFIGIFGEIAQSYSSVIAMFLALVLSPLIAWITDGKYYIARQNRLHELDNTHHICKICDIEYEKEDMAYCPFHDAKICSLCCSLDSTCYDHCKKETTMSLRSQFGKFVSQKVFGVFSLSPKISLKIFDFTILTSLSLFILYVTIWMVYTFDVSSMNEETHEELKGILFILFGVMSIFIGIFIWLSLSNKENRELAEKDLEDQKQQFESMVSNITGAIYRCRFDEHWTVLYMSSEIERISGYPASDFLNNSVRTFTSIMHEDDVDRVAEYAEKQIEQNNEFLNTYRIIDSNGQEKWIRDQGQMMRSEDGNVAWLDGAIFDVTEQKNAEQKIADNEQFVRTLLDSQDQLIITTNGIELITANETFLDFFAVDSISEFQEEYNAACVCDTFNTSAPEGFLQINIGRESWIDYVISRPYNTTHKAMITMGVTDFIFSVTAAKLKGKEGFKSAVFTDITAMEMAQREIESINKHTRESIEYASLIQSALIPDKMLFKNYFEDYFTIWQPKDIVGGDIYLFEELRDQDECLLMVIDCTGHGVPGAFVTMLVKAIERQIIAKINTDENIDVSPAWILAYFNKTMKKLLKQENNESISNAGLDGGIIYYNKKQGIIKFAGAETPLFYMQDDELKSIKGSRHSIGYKKSDINYEFKEHIIDVKKGMQFYLTTDGYFDQNGGKKGFPLGKKKFQNIIEENYKEVMADQQEVFLNTLGDYEADEERNDDVTLIGFRI